jgi:hypothetical protein
MPSEPKVVARAVVKHRPGCSYYIVGGEVWEHERRPGGDGSEDAHVKVASFPREEGFMYLVDGGGDIVRVPRPPEPSFDDNDELDRPRWRKFFAVIDHLLHPRDK